MSALAGRKNLAERKNLLDALAAVAGAAILPHFRTGFVVESKAPAGSFDPVTIADREAELAMRRLIAERFPEDGIVGEEFGAERFDARFQWVLDPIDGTRSFIAGLPIWGTLIGLLDAGRPVAGMMVQPFTGERYSGDGETARYAGPGGPRALATRRGRPLAEAVLYTTAPNLFTVEEGPAYRRVEAAVRLARYGADCYAYCMVAAGFVDVVVEAGLKPYDIVALIPIVEGAGGQVTGWDGGSAAKGGRIVASGDASLHAAVLDLLNR